MNFAKKRQDIVPVIPLSRDIFSTPRKSDITRKNSVINRGQVKKATFPNFVGMTPEYDQIAMNSTMPSFTDKNKSANRAAEMKISSGNFKFEMPKDLDSPGRRKINPGEYRGPNMSDCMYHTQ